MSGNNLNASSDAITNQHQAISFKANNLKYHLIRQLLENKEVDEISLIKKKLQMQEIAEKHSKGSQLDEDAIWREYAVEREKQKTQLEMSST